MAHLQFYSYPGFSEVKHEELWCSQAVRIGDYIEIAGQVMSNFAPANIPTDLDEEIDQAFANVDYTLKHASGKGWSQVYKIRLYLTDLGEPSVVAAVRNLKKWLPDHRPILTYIDVNQLGLPGMRNDNGGSTVAPQSNDATDYGLQRILDLPTELRCYILELLILDKSFDAYYALLEHPEIGELVHCNFNTQFRAVKRHRYLASQLRQILTTTALLSTYTNNPYSYRRLNEFFESNLLGEGTSASVDTPTQAVAVLKDYKTFLDDADILTDQFAKMTIGNALMTGCNIPVQPRYGTDTLSEVEHHRIFRAFLRLQLYTEIRKLYGERKGLKRKFRSLFSSWTTWEFDEVRSLAEWIKLEYPNLPQHYATSIRALFASVDAHFHNDMAPYVKIRPAPSRDRNRRSKFVKRSKRWTDTPETPDEGRADKRNIDWRPLGYAYGCYVNYTQRVYREHFLAGGYPFWSRYTIPRSGWWCFRNSYPHLQLRFGPVFDCVVEW
ncbi:hypothetical protein PTNB85_01328 [Pyrenophora teres f. teres]|nr:hypothetical protein PTNB85_01328 [Pyrenophora teres f. teres]